MPIIRLEERLNEYSEYFFMSGLKWKKAQKELRKGVEKKNIKKNRKRLIHQKRKKKKKLHG